MNYSQIIKSVSQKTGLPPAKIKTGINQFFQIVGETIAKNQRLPLPDFGYFGTYTFSAGHIPHLRGKFGFAHTKFLAPHFRPAIQLKEKIKNVIPKFKEKIPQEEDMLTRKVNIPYIDLSAITVPKEILALVPENIARKYQVVPVEKKDNTLIVAMIDPEDVETIELLKKRVGLKIEPRITTSADINHVLDQYSGFTGELKELVTAEIPKTKAGKAPAVPKEEEIAADAPAAKIVTSLIKRAVHAHASDIHIEPLETEVVVRFRIDGILQKIISLPKSIQPALVSRIKILCNLKIDETRLPQDGRFQITIERGEIDFRVSTLPTVSGEKVVARILDKSAGILTLEQLGVSGHSFKVLEENIQKAHGMTLVTGPTGSGKTTTLYAVLDKLMTEGVNIVTLEDPVEYRIPGINQCQVNTAIDFTFASGLRSIVRQDPDIIMVGEIRDFETAQMAIHAALTGHIVLSTLHTNDAAGAIPRLIDMKVEPFLIASSVNDVIAQRLCRKICDKCKKAYQPPPEEIETIKKEMANLESTHRELIPSKFTLYKGEGCGLCQKSGYKGRIGIFEIFGVTETIQPFVLRKTSASDLATQAIKEGMITMQQDGILKALQGVTTLEEVWRVTKD